MFLVLLFNEQYFTFSNQPFEVVVETKFWDQDNWSGDDSFGHQPKKHGFTNWPFAINGFKQSCGEAMYDYPFFTCDPDMVMVNRSYKGDDDANTAIYYSLSLYSNEKL